VFFLRPLTDYSSFWNPMYDILWKLWKHLSYVELLEYRKKLFKIQIARQRITVATEIQTVERHPTFPDNPRTCMCVLQMSMKLMQVIPVCVFYRGLWSWCGSYLYVCFTEVYEVDAGRTCMCVLQRYMKLMLVVPVCVFYRGLWSWCGWSCRWCPWPPAVSGFSLLQHTIWWNMNLWQNMVTVMCCVNTSSAICWSTNAWTIWIMISFVVQLKEKSFQ